MLFVSALLYTLAAGLRIWMATTMDTDQDRDKEQLTFSSFKTNVRTMVAMILGGGVITWIFVTDGVRDTAFRLSGELYPLYFEQIAGLSITQIGILGSFFSGAMMFTPILSGRISDRYGERVPISMGFLLIFTAFMVFLNTSIYAGFALAWVIFGFGVGLLSPAYQSLISKVVPQKILGMFSGLFRSSIGFISLPAPWIGAKLWEVFNPRLPFIITSIFSLLTIPPIWLKFKLPKKEESSAN
jgi:MFS family permease